MIGTKVNYSCFLEDKYPHTKITFITTRKVIDYFSDVVQNRNTGYLVFICDSPREGVVNTFGLYKSISGRYSIILFGLSKMETFISQKIYCINYPKLVAQIAPRFNNGIPEDAKDKLWFL